MNDLHVSDQLTVLVIDDAAINLKIIDRSLRRDGYRVLTATSGPTGRELAAREKPDIILLDISMPDENGFDTIRKLKENPETSSIPVMFLTAADDIKSKVEGFRLGAVDYILKPFHFDEIKARVRLHIKLNIATNALVTRQAEKLKQLHDAQTAMLIQPDEVPDAKFGVYYASLLEAGGDFYSVIPISDTIFAYFVADVSGHDIATSFVTASVKALLRQNCKPIYNPVESMKMVNSVLLETLPPGKYLTACYTLLNRNTRELTIVNMAHPPALYIPVSGPPHLIEMDGDVLGAFPDVMYKSVQLQVSKGDRLFMYSDGLVERLEDRSMWSDCAGDLLQYADFLKDIPIQYAVEELNQVMQDRKGDPDDDVVVLGVEV